MGSYGSTRWKNHSKKIQVEECRQMSISSFKPYLRPGYSGFVRWYRGQRKTGMISYRVQGDEKPRKITLVYTITDWSGEKVDCNYQVNFETTPLPWGGERYWFQCPLQECGRRVGCLYLPPGEINFGCRHCYDLTYRSSQEAYQQRKLYESLAGILDNKYPGLYWKDARAIWFGGTTPNLQNIIFEKYFQGWANNDPYAHYLTPEQLCEQSGLDPDDILQLKTARLLLPDRPDGRYRPKLASWGKKLAFLLAKGWEIEDIKRWSKGRWKSKNPKHWPPSREDWLVE